MYKGHTKFRHTQGEAGAEASLFVPFLSFCVFEDTFKGLRLACSVMMQGISWTNEEIGQKVFGWQKSFFYKVVKAGKLQPEVIETFKAKCDEVESQGQEPNRSLEGLLKFAKQVETGTQASGEGESEMGDAETTGEAQVETRVETILTFTFKGESGNVAVRIDANGVVKTTNTDEQIREAIAVLNFSLQNR